MIPSRKRDLDVLVYDATLTGTPDVSSHSIRRTFETRHQLFELSSLAVAKGPHSDNGATRRLKLTEMKMERRMSADFKPLAVLSHQFLWLVGIISKID